VQAERGGSRRRRQAFPDDTLRDAEAGLSACARDTRASLSTTLLRMSVDGVKSEMQKALGSVVTSMVSTQDGIRSIATVLTQVCNAVNVNAAVDSQPRQPTAAPAGIATDYP